MATLPDDHLLSYVDGDKSYSLVLFDLDGTLIKGHVERPDPDGPFVQLQDFNVVIPLPGRVRMIERLVRAEVNLGVCTNKAGVAFGHHTVEECSEKAKLCAARLGLPPGTSWTETYDHPNAKLEKYRRDSWYRKPAPGMLLKSLIYHETDPADALFVGDMAVDEVAAERAGVDFIHADIFFA